MECTTDRAGGPLCRSVFEKYWLAEEPRLGNDSRFPPQFPLLSTIWTGKEARLLAIATMPAKQSSS